MRIWDWEFESWTRPVQISYSHIHILSYSHHPIFSYSPNVQVFQLFLTHPIRCPFEQRACRRRLRECDHIAQARHPGQQHYDAVEAECEAAVGWRAVPERLEQEPELRFRLFLAQAQCAEDVALQRLVVDANGAARQLVAVVDRVVCA